MKKTLFALCSLFALLAISVYAQAGDRTVIVAGSLGDILSDTQSNGGEVLHFLSHHNGFVADLPHGLAKKLASKYKQAIIEPDYEVSLIDRTEVQAKGDGTTQPPQSIPWGISAIQAPEAFAITRGAGILVCVVDTGIQANHPDLSTNVAGGENFVVIRGKIDPAKWADDNGHGTHVSGTIAALDNTIGVIGVAPDAKLFAAKVLDRRGSGYSSAVADGIRSCTTHGARVINMSLGSSSDSSLIRAAVQDAFAAGVVIVAAAGNESGAVSYPARYPEVLAISAVDSSLNLAWFSNFGPEVDFAAPGVSVLSTYKGSTYATLNGTSMASPHAAGVAALALASGSLGILGDDLGLPPEYQGMGFINAYRTVLNR